MLCTYQFTVRFAPNTPPSYIKSFIFGIFSFFAWEALVPELLGLQCHETTSRITEHEVSQTSVSGGAMA